MGFALPAEAIGEAQEGSNRNEIILDMKHTPPEATPFNYYMDHEIEFISGANACLWRVICHSDGNKVVVRYPFPCDVSVGDKYFLKH